MNASIRPALAALVLAGIASAAPPVFAQQSSNALPAPAVVRVPTTYGKGANPAPQFVQSMDYGSPYHSRAEIAANQANVRAARAAQYAAYVRRFGPGKTLRLKSIPARYR